MSGAELLQLSKIPDISTEDEGRESQRLICFCRFAWPWVGMTQLWKTDPVLLETNSFTLRKGWRIGFRTRRDILDRVKLFPGRGYTTTSDTTGTADLGQMPLTSSAIQLLGLPRVPPCYVASQGLVMTTKWMIPYDQAIVSHWWFASMYWPHWWGFIASKHHWPLTWSLIINLVTKCYWENQHD